MKKFLNIICISALLRFTYMQCAESGYTKDFVDLIELIYGEGFLELGGNESIDIMFQGIELDGKKMLDIGSGLGGVELYLAQKYTIDIIGVYPEKSLIGEAKMRLNAIPTHSLKGSVKFQELLECCNLQQYADESFDIVMSRGALLHVPHHLKIPYFAEMFRVLKPGGILIIDDWMHNSSDYSANVVELIVGTGLAFHLVTPAEYEKNLQKAGFVSLHMKDTTAHFAELSAHAVVRVQACKEEIEKRFNADYYRYSLRGWTLQAQVFRSRELLTGIIRAYRPIKHDV
jgi:cyclopropane fatty-acyl-phospholipid synthase-like methyltransferase